MKKKSDNNFLVFILSTIVSFTVLSVPIFLYVLFINTIENSPVASENIIKEASLFNTASIIENSDYTQANEPDLQPATVSESDIYLIPLGDIFGIKLYTDGIIVTSLSEIYADGEYHCPADDANIMPGDYITHINKIQIDSNAHFTELLAQFMPNSIELTIIRNKETIITNLTPVFDGTAYRCGMWIRDSAAGIGTLTFVDPVTGMFAGLGHAICEPDTGAIMPLKDGSPTAITISTIEKAEAGLPGKINGFFSSTNAIGTLSHNSETGIYGTLYDIPQKEKFPVTPSEEVEKGAAQILASVTNDGAEIFNVNIESIPNPDGDIKNVVIKITDERLMAITGGIIQGMSGTPVIKDGELTAAISHVFIDDPTRGYGIFIENMLESAENIAE